MSRSLHFCGRSFDVTPVVDSITSQLVTQRKTNLPIKPLRRDKERLGREMFDCLMVEISCAFAAPEESYKWLDAAEVIARNRR